MPLTIAQIMSVSYPSVAHEMRVDYQLGQILDGPDGINRGAIYSRNYQQAALFQYARDEEVRMRSERERIAFAASLLQSATHVLTRAINEGRPGGIVPDEVAIDVDFSED